MPLWHFRLSTVLFSHQNSKLFCSDLLYQRCLEKHFGSKMPKIQGEKAKREQNKGAEAAPSDRVAGEKPVSSRPDNSIVIRILAKPGAKQNSITGFTADSVGVQIAAPPVDGEANTELIKYITKTLGIRKSDVHLDKGSKSRVKILLLEKGCGLSVQAVIDKLQAEAQM